ncbi:MAG: HNH nuclease family protein [Verrucomicrobia bacterium]|nr:HNH nuclease family protein [Verrucomicrobiota bacterium]
MPLNDAAPDADRHKQALARILRDQEFRQKGYRERALKMYPHICASCGREFSGKRLRELTVHHRDHNHDNNPPDGSNWELLCLYCHDHEHEKSLIGKYYEGAPPAEASPPPLVSNPFEGLDTLLKSKDEKPKTGPE